MDYNMSACGVNRHHMSDTWDVASTCIGIHPPPASRGIEEGGEAQMDAAAPGCVVTEVTLSNHIIK